MGTDGRWDRLLFVTTRGKRLTVKVIGIACGASKKGEYFLLFFYLFKFPPDFCRGGPFIFLPVTCLCLFYLSALRERGKGETGEVVRGAEGIWAEVRLKREKGLGKGEGKEEGWWAWLRSFGHR